MKSSLKLKNNTVVNYALKKVNDIDMGIIIQELVALSEKLYSSECDSCVSSSYELDYIIDSLIDVK